MVPAAFEPSDISILYVDDEPLLLNVGKMFLEKTAGYSVTTVSSVRDALNQLSEKSFDAIVSDYQMQEVDGIEFLKLLRNSGNKTPFIIFTGRGREDLVIEALNEGADFYLQKGGDPKSQFAELKHKIKRAVQARRAEEALESRVVALTQPPGDACISFEDIFDIDEIQHIQDDFSRGTGVASIITRPDGTPITRPSNFTRLCNDIIRKTEIGCINCHKSDASIGRPNPDGPIVQICLSGGLWDAGASIIIEGHHIANWLAGQVRNEAQTEEKMLEYARKIGADEEAFLEAYREVPSMSLEKFQKIAELLFTMANQLSGSAYYNLCQARSIAEHERIEKELYQKTEELNATYEQLAASGEELRQNYEALVNHEKELLESENKFKSLVEYSLDGIVITNFSANILFVNRAMGRILDIENYKELSGSANLMDFIAPDSHASVISVLDRVSRGIDSYLVKYEIIANSGREKVVECIGKKIPYNDSEAMLLFVWDVSERKHTEEHLRESENKFSTVFKKSPLPLAIVSAEDGKFTDVNNAFTRETGYPYAEVVGKTSNEIAFFPDREEYESFRSLLEESGEYNGSEIKIQTKNGDLCICRFSSKVIFMNGKPYIIFFMEDVTESRLAEEAIRFANRKLHILSGITRHDILNLIMVIKGSLEIAGENINDPAVVSCLENIRGATASIQKHIEFTGEYENLGVEKPVWLNIKDIVDSMKDERITLRNHCSGVEVNGDQMFEKVFQNLMENTIRHGGATEVKVSCIPSDGILKIIWEDNGLGIPDSDKEKIFEKGFGKTSGFGLFLSREILAITGIGICETGNEGEGVRFEMTVPGSHFVVN